MKNLLIVSVLLILTQAINSRESRTSNPETLSYCQSGLQESALTATMKNSSRLFKAREDLTSVIVIIPKGASVSVLGSDSTYLAVTYAENTGYIYKRDAVIDKLPVNTAAAIISQAPQQAPQHKPQPADQPQGSRYSYLEGKYGSSMAARLYAGKVWKGMNSGMVKDSWGPAQKINREVSGSIIKEEWVYRNSWLYFENNTLLDWGPVMK